MSINFRSLPSVDKVLSDSRMARLAEIYPHSLLLELVRGRLEAERASIAGGSPAVSIDGIVESVSAQLKALDGPGPRPVINASGVILHTNLGRAALSKDSLSAMDTVGGYCDLEFDLESGTRGSRQAHIEPVLCQLTGAEAALVVNNNAGAVLLALSALAKRKEVIISRGQSVEIGGSFRIPDVMKQSGAKLVEVGTTNCTYINDFEQAITPSTAALMRVHSSNFLITGFTHEVSIEELTALGRKCDLPVLDDLGSGCLLDTTAFGLGKEPMVQESIRSGCALALFSGDKLVGGPQAGIVVGEKELVAKLKKHPLARALRIDKSRLAALKATLRHYLRGDALAEVPVWRMISTPVTDIQRRAQQWAGAWGETAEVVPGDTGIGGGSLPGSVLPTWLVSIKDRRKEGILSRTLGVRLRREEIPVIGRVSRNAFFLDPRCVLPEDDGLVLHSLAAVRSEFITE